MDADGHGFGRDKRLNRKDAEVAEKTEEMNRRWTPMDTDLGEIRD